MCLVKDEGGKVGSGLNLKRHVYLAREFELYHTGNRENQRTSQAGRFSGHM